MEITHLGWDKSWQLELSTLGENYIPGRVCRVDRGAVRVLTESGEHVATIPGRVQHRLQSKSDYPAVGDWVALEKKDQSYFIEAILPRRSRFTRKETISGGRKMRTIDGKARIVGGATEEQVIAANADAVFLMSALDQNFSLRTVEVYLAVAIESGAQPIIILNKADLCSDWPSRLAETKQICKGYPVHVVSAQTGLGMDELAVYLGTGKTVALLGPSGVGKSTIANALSGSRLLTGEVRQSDSRGRHTTTWRELVALPTGGVLMDTAGLRKILFWNVENGLKEAFSDIEELISQCRFSNCSHRTEPGCALREALENGELDTGRLENYRKIQFEAAYMAQRKKQKASHSTKRR